LRTAHNAFWGRPGNFHEKIKNLKKSAAKKVRRGFRLAKRIHREEISGRKLQPAFFRFAGSNWKTSSPCKLFMRRYIIIELPGSLVSVLCCILNCVIMLFIELSGALA
jgi:hypothetical protein